MFSLPILSPVLCLFWYPLNKPFTVLLGEKKKEYPLGRGNGGNRNTNLIIQVKDGSGLDQSGSSEAGKKWLDPRHILKEEVVGFQDQLLVGHEKREGYGTTPRFWRTEFGWTELLFTEMGKMRDQEVCGRNAEVQFYPCLV